jgi:hypothetical protein
LARADAKPPRSGGFAFLPEGEEKADLARW